MKKALVDANVILRYLTRDPPAMAEAALKIFNEARTGKISLSIIPITVAEVVWTLESFYGYSKQQIAETMTQFLLCEGLEVEGLDLFTGALTLYHKKNLDFADAILAITSLRKGPKIIYSFDRHLDRVDGLKRLEPGHGDS
ncbi:MAG: PIN domain-containing protein [Thermodesulfobacteriota bacterium]